MIIEIEDDVPVTILIKMAAENGYMLRWSSKNKVRMIPNHHAGKPATVKLTNNLHIEGK